MTLNDKTIKSLKEYLNSLPDDTKLVFIDGNYNERILQTCCNFEHQKEIRTVQVMAGEYIESN